MWRFYAIGFGVLLGFDTAAQLAFKQAAIDALPMTADLPWMLRVLTGFWVWVAVGGYLGAFATYMTLLQRAPVGPAFAAAHLEVVTVTFFAVPIFGETLGWQQLLGAAMILAGIACIAKGEAMEACGDEAEGVAADGRLAAPPA